MPDKIKFAGELAHLKIRSLTSGLKSLKVDNFQVFEHL